MFDELVPHAHDASVAPRSSAFARVRMRRAMVRQDRRSSARARNYLLSAALGEAEWSIGLTWSSAGGCAVCAADPRGHGGATGMGSCLVGALVLCAHGDADTVRAAVDRTWRALHRGRNRPVHWNGPRVQEAIQTRELRAWNDTRARGAGDVVALLRAAQTL